MRWALCQLGWKRSFPFWQWWSISGHDGVCLCHEQHVGLACRKGLGRLGFFSP